MSSRFISRREYNLLLVRHPDWMRSAWLAYSRSWGIRGVFVSGTQEALAELDRSRAECRSPEMHST